MGGPTDTERDQDVRRLLDRGARHVDVGQGDVSWVVMADPEGNEFCVLADRRCRSDALRSIVEHVFDS